jgi:3-oxoacyl-[acyl-carrier-protein] synthase II
MPGGGQVRDVAVTGVGVVSALGHDVDSFLGGLTSGTVRIHPAPWAREGPGEYFSWMSLVTAFNPLDWMGEKVRDGTDLFSQYALAAATQAVGSAGLTDAVPPSAAVVHGTTMGGVRGLMKAQHDLEAKGPAAIDRKTMIRIWPNMAAAQIAMRFGLHGPQLTVTSACASSLDAVGVAAGMIASGRAPVAIVGGTDAGWQLPPELADESFVPALFYSRSQYGVNSAQRDPNRASLPFDTDRNGVVGGEGSAFFVLEDAESARNRGATVLAEIAGYASLADGFHPSSPEPSGKWEAEAMRQALANAELPAGEVGAVVAHATATPKGDTAEIRAINEVYGDHAGRLHAMSFKGHIGHTGASAGGMGLLIAIGALTRGVLPHTACTVNPDPEADFHVVTEAPVGIDTKAVQVNAFGFGGQNASVVVTRSA